MADTTYDQALQSAFNEHEKLSGERAQIDERLAQLEKIMESLAPLCQDENLERAPSPIPAPPYTVRDLGLADACREVLRVEKRYMTPIGIRECLIKHGYDETKQTNLLASIHSIAKRLVGSKEAEQSTIGSKTYYRWTGSSPITLQLTDSLLQKMRDSVRPITGYSGIKGMPKKEK